MGFGIGLLLIFACAKDVPPRMLADFNSGHPPNNVGGTYGPFMANEEDPDQFCRVSYSTENRAGDTGYALRLDYDVDDTKPAYNGFWMKLQNLDASAYGSLSIRLHGDPAGCTKRVKLELKNAQQVGRATVDGITATPHVFRVPFSSFQGITNFGALTEFVIVFDDMTSTKKVGTLYVDEIELRPES